MCIDLGIVCTLIVVLYIMLFWNSALHYGMLLNQYFTVFVSRFLIRFTYFYCFMSIGKRDHIDWAFSNHATCGLYITNLGLKVKSELGVMLRVMICNATCICLHFANFSVYASARYNQHDQQHHSPTLFSNILGILVPQVELHLEGFMNMCAQICVSRETRKKTS